MCVRGQRRVHCSQRLHEPPSGLPAGEAALLLPATAPVQRGGAGRGAAVLRRLRGCSGLFGSMRTSCPASNEGHAA
eukprot:10665505-Alexandrium_andersonii.AAC.1